MTPVANALYKTKRTLKEVCGEFGIPLSECGFDPLETCSNCDIWYKKKEMLLDLDSNLICRVCFKFFGL